MCFPHTTENFELRDSNSNLNDISIIETTLNIQHHDGVKGYSAIPEFNFIEDTCLEYMHQQSNCTKKLMEICSNGVQNMILPLTRKYLLEKFLHLKLPSSLASFTISLKKWKQWKSIHWKYFTIYFFIPLYFGDKNVPKPIWNIWLTYIQINLLITCKSINIEYTDNLQQLCNSFVEKLTEWNSTNITINNHLLKVIFKKLILYFNYNSN